MPQSEVTTPLGQHSFRVATEIHGSAALDLVDSIGDLGNNGSGEMLLPDPAADDNDFTVRFCCAVVGTTLPTGDSR